jgi:hypothetical protein
VRWLIIAMAALAGFFVSLASKYLHSLANNHCSVTAEVAVILNIS